MRVLIGVLAFVLLAGGVAYWVFQQGPEAPEILEPVVDIIPEEVPPEPTFSVREIGTSVEGRAIEAYQFGSGDRNVLFVGGMHGGYEWNSVALAYEMVAYLESDESTLPENVTVHIIPNLNPDGVAVVTPVEGELSTADIVDPTSRVADGRFNANDVDLNRNFDCKWAPESTWRGNVVSAGTSAFSEPEAVALRDYVFEINPSAVIFWHSQANNVYASECHEGPLADTLKIMDLYAQAADYGAVPSFDAYPITGDAEGWLASIGIPAITVELEGYTTTEWSRNLAGFKALMAHYATDALAR